MTITYKDLAAAVRAAYREGWIERDNYDHGSITLDYCDRDWNESDAAALLVLFKKEDA